MIELVSKRQVDGTGYGEGIHWKCELEVDGLPLTRNVQVSTAANDEEIVSYFSKADKYTELQYRAKLRRAKEYKISLDAYEFIESLKSKLVILENTVAALEKKP